MSNQPTAVLRQLRESLPLAQQPWNGNPVQASVPEAAVLVLLTRESEPQTLLGRRALHLPHHPGEVAFAGGKREPGDISPWDTALRETWEEVGIAADDTEAIGELPPLMTRTGFRVHPCVAAIAPEPALTVDPSEFDSVFMLPFATFADSSIFRLLELSDGEHTRKVPHYQVGEDSIWGVTAAILAMLANVAYDAGLDLQRNWKLTP